MSCIAPASFVHAHSPPGNCPLLGAPKAAILRKCPPDMSWRRRKSWQLKRLYAGQLNSYQKSWAHTPPGPSRLPTNLAGALVVHVKSPAKHAHTAAVVGANSAQVSPAQ